MSFDIICIVRDITCPGRLNDFQSERLTGLCLSTAKCFPLWTSVRAGVALPTPRTQAARGTVLQQCARNALPAQSDFLRRPALAELLRRPPPTSSTRAPAVTPN